MKNLKLLAMVSAIVCVLNITPVYAQSAGNNATILDTIVVTGRHREESLQEVPVSASVLSNTLIQDAGISTLFDLYEMVPGLHYDEGEDRLAALPSIRGIRSNDIAPNRTKVSSFVDGIPVLGSAGSIGFNGFQQVEVYRGPQSAAFGRSTFAGAINYVTQDPGDTFEGNVSVNVSDYGTKTASFNLGGPISDKLGFLLSYTKEDSGTPDEYHAVGNAGYRNDLVDTAGILGTPGAVIETNVDLSDGTEFGARAGDNIAGKLVFTPDDTMKMSLSFNHVETQDQRAARLFVTQAERDACFEGNGVYVNAGMMAPWLVGEMDCDWSNTRDLYGQHDLEHFLNVNPLNLQFMINAALAGNDALVNPPMGVMGPPTGTPEPATPLTLSDGTVLSVEEQILLMAKAWSVPKGDRGSLSNRDRFTFQLDKLLANGSAVQFSYMQSEESVSRANANVSLYYYDPDNLGVFEDGMNNTYDTAEGIDFEWEGYAGGMTGWAVNGGGGNRAFIQPSFSDSSEQYAELRWVSAAEDRLRWVVGASYYDYNYLEERWNTPMGFEPVSGLAQLWGQDFLDQYVEIAHGADPNFTYVTPGDIIADNARNQAVYFNTSYDLTDKLTFSLEGRYASDTVGASNEVTGLSEEVTTNSFTPRVSLTYNLTENTSYYLQWAQGINPAGINVGVLSADTINVLDNGVPNGLIPYNATIALTDTFDNDDGSPVPDGIADAYDDVNGIWYTDGTWTTPLAGATYDHGFTAEDFTTYKEEQITQLEFGFKGTVLDGRLTYSGAIYDITWKDQIQAGSINLNSPCASGDPALVTLTPCVADGVNYLYVSNADGGTISTNLNFGDVKIRGAEIEANYRVTDHWDVRAQASIMKGEYDQFCDIGLFNNINFSQLDGTLAVGPPGQVTFPDYMGEFGLEIREPTAGETLTSTCYVTDGNALARQPEISWSLSPSFTTDIGSMRFNARLDVRHESKLYESSANFNWYPAVTTANLSFGLSGDSWSTTLYVNNLTDDDTPYDIFGIPDDTSRMGLIDYVTAPNTELTGYLGETWLYSNLIRDSFQFRPRNPRTIGLRATYRF